MKENRTYQINFNDGTNKLVYCKKEELENYITIAEYRKLKDVTILNTLKDKVNHRPIVIKI